MGRRSTATTKSGKFMNPTDQARKEARKKELKKNKKQRVLVRTAVLKGKDPATILEEMEGLDTMEYNTEGDAPILHEKVIQEKRKKLRDTYIRVMRMYEKEEPAQYAELRRQLNDYEKRRAQMEQYAMSVKVTESVNPSEIPLPDVPMGTAMVNPMMGIFGLSTDPSVQGPPVHSILKKAIHVVAEIKKAEAPGPPPGPPPQLSDSEDENSGDEAYGSSRFGEKTGSSRVRFSGIEPGDAEKDSRSRFKAPGKSGSTPDEDRNRYRGGASIVEMPPGLVAVPPRLIRPPPPPPTMPPPMREGSRMPPPPPPGFPPQRLLRPPLGMPMPTGSFAAASSTAPLSSTISHTISRPHTSSEGSSGTAVIEAKPQLRNMTAEVTRLVPTAVKVRREPTGPIKMKPRVIQSGNAASMIREPSSSDSAQSQPIQRSKDDAYDQFMREVQGLL